jgi:predicted metalloendopeptidase
LQLDQPGFGMPGRKYYLKGINDTMVQAYKTLAKNVAEAFNAVPATAENDMKEVVRLEIEIANVRKKFVIFHFKNSRLLECLFQ